VALYHVDSDWKQLEERRPVSFADEHVWERWHLQRVLREHPAAIDPDIKIISEEFSAWTDSSRRIDLLGLDKAGNLVVIELKRVEGGEHMDLQALRYAAMVSPMIFETAVKTYESFLTDTHQDAARARQELEEHLAQTDGPSISSKPRVVLVAPSFSKELTTTVLWLNAQLLDIRCVAANLYNLDGQHYLHIEQVIPLPSAADYVVDLAHQRAEQERVATGGAQFLFWAQFGQYLELRGGRIPMGKPQNRSLNYVTGLILFRLDAWRLLQNDHLGARVRFNPPSDPALQDAQYDVLDRDFRDRVERDLMHLGTVRLHGRAEHEPSVVIEHPGNPSESQEDRNRWLAEALEGMYELLT
jgi:hypothetical protein